MLFPYACLRDNLRIGRKAPIDELKAEGVKIK